MTRNLFETDGRFIHQACNTPLIPLQLDENIQPIWCKLEFLNPSGSCKDRIARYILEKAWRAGKIGPGDTVVEASSGSTSIALSLVCAQLGLKFIAVMNDNVSSERVLMIKAYGGKIASIPKAEGIGGAIAYAEEQASKNGYFLSDQFKNPDNPEAHMVWTGQEVLSQIPNGIVDAVVNGVGTGGTLVGLYQAFRNAGGNTTAYAARPIHGDSAISEMECCSFSSRVPGVIDGMSKILTEEAVPDLKILEIDEEVAISTTKQLIRRGFPVGPSSGLNYAAAIEIGKQLGKDAQIVTVFPDRMERYFSTELFDHVK